jgi:dTDP-4-amino-4,6-dideoxygalactose transaminase
MTVFLNNLYLQNKIFYKKIIKDFKNSIVNSDFIGGNNINKFESNFKRKVKSKYCVSVANGTDGLIISLKCLNIKKGDEVITTSHSWVSTAEAIVAVGAKPVFVDTDKFFTINADLIEKKISIRTKAIIPVHLYGQPCDMTKILLLAKKYNLKIIEDCAQAHLTKFKKKIVGNFGDVGVFSFYPGKNLGAFGDAGAIICKKKKIYNLIRKYRNHGSIKKNNHEVFGINSRLDTVQANILNEKLVKLKYFNYLRNINAKIYRKYLKNNNNIQLPLERKFSYHSYHQFVIKVNKKRDSLRDYLKIKKIETAIHYPKMLFNIRPFIKFKGEDKFAISQINEKEILSLPMHPFLSKKQIMYICKHINIFFKN